MISHLHPSQFDRGLRQDSDLCLSLGLNRVIMYDVELRLDVEDMFTALVLRGAERHCTLCNSNIDVRCHAASSQRALDLGKLNSTNNGYPGVQRSRHRKRLGVYRGNELQGWFT